MDSHTLYYEIKRLMKDNKKWYISLFVLFFVGLITVLLLPSFLSTNNDDSNEKRASEIGSENPAIFELYIEYDTGTSFTNTILLEQAMKTRAFVEGAEEATGVEISDLLDYEEKTNYIKTAKDRGVLGASRDLDSNIWIFSSSIGTEEENLAVIEYFYELFANNEIELLQNKSLYTISPPRVLTDDELSSPTTPVEQTTAQGISMKNVVVSVILSFVGALVISFMVLLIRTFFTKRIQYAFNYSWGEQDLFILISKENKEIIQQMLKVQTSRKKLYLAQNPDQVTIENMQVLNSVAHVDTEDMIEEVIVFVQPQTTEKTWYNQQRELLKAFRIPLKIVQLNENSDISKSV